VHNVSTHYSNDSGKQYLALIASQSDIHVYGIIKVCPVCAPVLNYVLPSPTVKS